MQILSMFISFILCSLCYRGTQAFLTYKLFLDSYKYYLQHSVLFTCIILSSINYVNQQLHTDSLAITYALISVGDENGHNLSLKGCFWNTNICH